MAKEKTRYNPNMPSEGYDKADLAALRGSNITPVLANAQLRFDSAEDASLFLHVNWTM